MRRYDAVFFDMGHTLVEFVQTPDARASALRPFGLTASADDLAVAMDEAVSTAVATLDGDPAPTVDGGAYTDWWSGIYRQALRRAGFAGDEEGAVQAMWDQWLYETWRLYPDVPGLLDRLAESGYAVGIISNWPPTLDATCRRLGLTERCPLIVCSALVGWEKPDPRIFRAALDRAGVVAGRAVHVGDNYESDVVGARSVGMDAVHLVRPGLPEAGGASYPDPPPDGVTRLSSLDELHALID